jgi:hypothetical protein
VTRGVFALVSFLSACVLADPAPSLPIVQESAPTVLARVPPAQVIAGDWPDRFTIDVTVLDPAESLQWLAFVDFIPDVTIESSNPNNQPVNVPASLDGGPIQVVVAGIPRPLGPGCHTFNVVIAPGDMNDPGFTGIVPVNAAYAASQSWVYTESGNPGACAAYDAGAFVDGTFPDAKPGD